MLRKIKHFLQNNRKMVTYSTAGLLVVLIVGGAFFFNNSGQGEQTLIVQPADFVQQVSVSGKVVAAENVNLGFDQGGRVAGVYASVGEVVPAGKVLANVENGDLQADLATEEANLAALKRGTRPEELVLEQAKVTAASTDLTNAKQVAINAVRDSYTKAQDAVFNYTDTFFTNPQNAAVAITISTPSSEKERNINSERLLVTQTFSKWQNTLNVSTKESVSETMVVVNSYLDVIKSFMDNLSSIVVFYVTANPSVDHSDKIATINSATAVLNQSIDAITTASNSLNAAQSAYNQARFSYELKQAGSTPEDLVAGQARVDADRAKLAKTMVVAPFAGMVTKMDVKVGENVSPNTSVISLIGADGTFQIESYVPEINIALVAVGNVATTTLDAYGTDVPFTTKVISIDPAETIRDGVSTYKVKLQFIDKDDRIKSGMTASVTITTASKTDVIAVPQGIVKTVNGQKFVLVKEKGEIVERIVTTGKVSSLGQIEILSGLQAGAEVILDTSN